MSSPDRSAEFCREVLTESRESVLYALFADYPAYYDDVSDSGDTANLGEHIRSCSSSATGGLDGLPSVRFHSPSADLSRSSISEDEEDPIITTFMIKGLPARATPEFLMQILQSAGLSGAYDYIHLPRNKSKRSSFRYCKGYAYVNFCDGRRPSELRSAFALSPYLCRKPKDGKVIVPASIQGVEANLEFMASTRRALGKEVRDLDGLREHLPDRTFPVFSDVLIRVGGVMEPMEAPDAYQFYRTQRAFTGG
jgi:hypothetical protein